MSTRPPCINLRLPSYGEIVCITVKYNPTYLSFCSEPLLPSCAIYSKVESPDAEESPRSRSDRRSCRQPPSREATAARHEPKQAGRIARRFIPATAEVRERQEQD